MQTMSDPLAFLHQSGFKLKISPPVLAQYVLVPRRCLRTDAVRTECGQAAHVYFSRGHPLMRGHSDTKLGEERGVWGYWRPFGGTYHPFYHTQDMFRHYRVTLSSITAIQCYF